LCGGRVAEERFGVQVVIHHVHVILQIAILYFLSRPKNITKKTTTKNSLSILIIQRRFPKGVNFAQVCFEREKKN